MKNLLMIAIALVTISTTAQERKKDDRKADMKERMEMRERMTPQEIAELQTKEMTLHLDLTDKQQAEVQKVLIEETITRKAKMAELKAKRGSSDEEKPSKEELLKMRNDRLDQQIAMKRKMKEILTVEQFKKYEIMQMRKDGEGRNMRYKNKSKK